MLGNNNCIQAFLPLLGFGAASQAVLGNDWTTWMKKNQCRQLQNELITFLWSNGFS